MWKTVRDRDRVPVEECHHPERVETAFAGLGRAVCEACGHVSVSYLYDMFAEQREQLRTDEEDS